ncbi:cytochrome P450 [Streptomyces sp. NPDC088354]|uniref:cytochrome P450 family protein n=1 Tax=Streptomyces sp. NPDC088354 TaxID=3365856 RepID=UPI0037FF0FAB
MTPKCGGDSTPDRDAPFEPRRVLLDSAFKADSPSQFTQLRAQGPVHPVVFSSGLEGWLVVRHQQAREALTHPSLLKDPRPAAAALEAAGYVAHRADVGGGHMLDSDPPVHTRLRRLVAGAFTSRRMVQLQPRIEEIAYSLLDALPPSGEVDLVAGYTAPIPVTVIAELLGIPEEYRHSFRNWASDALAVGTPRSEPAFANLRQLLAELIGVKSSSPQDDLMSALIAVRDQDNGKLSHEELVSTMLNLLIAGHETTVNLLGNAILALLQHPHQLERLRAEPNLIATAVEEFLRYDSSVEISTLRFAAEDLEIGDTLITKGSIVAVALSSASRDMSVDGYGNPHRLDVTRPTARHLAFGHGIHHCLGAPLARIEATVALSALLARLQHLELAIPTDEIEWIPNGIMRGPLSIPVRYYSEPPRVR